MREHSGAIAAEGSASNSDLLGSGIYIEVLTKRHSVPTLSLLQT